MSEYRAPLDDVRFVLSRVADLPAVCALPRFAGTDMDTVTALLGEAGRFMTEVMSPLNPVGDRQGARLEHGGVRMPEGFRAAYQRFVGDGWGAISQDAELGGGGLPYAVAVVVTEMLASSNMAMGLCPALGEGAIESLVHHGSETLRSTFLPKLVRGEWSATMDLTEPQAGSDLGAIRTTATRQPDGSYRIKGTKIFITYGDHDLAENIVHLVLARTPDAPAGTRGISCFIVPKFLVEPDGRLGARNDMHCVSLEHKLGIHASPTCVMSYGDEGGAVGYLIGEEHEGLRYMFTMMNRERIFVGTQGLGIAERAYQRAAAYARERRQGRAVGLEAPGGEPSPIVDHADVRRTLLTMRASVEAMRALLYVTATTADLANHHPDAAVRHRTANRVALLTPVVKGWLSDLGVEVASLGVQVHGGVGYVEETGAAQHLRDARITPIYEGTNGIQAFDLVMRKLPLEGGAVVRAYGDEIRALDEPLAGAGEVLRVLRERLAAGRDTLMTATKTVLGYVGGDKRAAAAVASPYLRLFGVVAGAHQLARGALAATRANGDFETSFLAAKVATARIYAEQVLPQAASLLPAIEAGASVLDEIAPELL